MPVVVKIFFFRVCCDVGDTFSSSVIYKIQEKWAVCLSYRLKSLSNWFNVVTTGGLINSDTLNEMQKLIEVTVAGVVR